MRQKHTPAPCFNDAEESEASEKRVISGTACCGPFCNGEIASL